MELVTACRVCPEKLVCPLISRGDARFPQRRVWMTGIAGNTASGFASQGYDSAMSAQLDPGVLEYCGAQERRLELLYGSIEGESHVDWILLEAERLASGY